MAPMSAPIRRVALVAKPGSLEATELAREIQRFLRARGIEVVFEAAVAAALGVEAASVEALRAVELCVVAGGDGTLIHAVRLLDGVEVPIFGVNAGGQLGFLTEIPRGQAIEQLGPVVEGRFAVEARMKLRVTLERGGRQILRTEVLNDAVINRGAQARMVDLRTTIDGVPVTRFRADGVIVATPTGSTAYSLAAHGPILSPMLEAIIVNPICPHTLTQRPLVVPARCCMSIELLGATGEILLSLDGIVGEQLQLLDRVVIERSEKKLLLVKNPGLDFYGILRSKLGWGER